MKEIEHNVSAFDEPVYKGNLCGKFFLADEVPGKKSNIQFRGSDTNIELIRSLRSPIDEDLKFIKRSPKTSQQGIRQGYRSDNWIKIDFWTDDLDHIIFYIDTLLKRLKENNINIQIEGF